MLNHVDLNNIREILANCREYAPGHHMHHPFMSAYQIAIRFAKQNPHHEDVIRLPVGGTGAGENQSLAQYIARHLSSEIRNSGDTGGIGIEGGFLSHDNLINMEFRDSHGEAVHVSTLESKHAHSIFRISPPKR